MGEEQVNNIKESLATVVKVIDSYTVVINRGSNDDVSKGDKYLVYYVEPEELSDPETGESLGKLEVVRGTGKVVHLQERMATLESNEYSQKRKIVRRVGGPGGVRFAAGIAGLLGETEEEEAPPEQLPFDAPSVGDRAKPV